MVSVRINGTDTSVNSGGLSRFTELVELIKTLIDPDHMITGILVNGNELSDEDWGSALNRFETSIVEIETGTPEEFVANRMGKVADVVRSCFNEFRDSRKHFQAGDMLQGNQALVKAVNTTKAFFDWYSTILQLVPGDSSRFDIRVQVEQLAECCKKICQQQLYQSWWALGETIEKELEPKLDKLEDFCRGFRKAN